MMIGISVANKSISDISNPCMFFIPCMPIIGYSKNSYPLLIRIILNEELVGSRNYDDAG